MDHPLSKDEPSESSRTTNGFQSSVNQKSANKCFDDDDILSEIEDLSAFCQPAFEEPEVPNSYFEEWERLFGGVTYMDKLRSTGIKGHLRNCRFRSICWRVYLECLSEDKELWVTETEALRNKYDKILHELQTNPRCDSEDLDLCLNNPLSQSDESPWNQYFQDSELKSTIQQDVCRTFPEIEFFHTEEVQAMMVNVLFCYARKFPHISYRQGMHELLAPIIFVLHSDQQAYLHASEIELLDLFEPNTRFSISILLNPNYTEHDAFFLMCQLMEAVESWYVLNENITSKGHINFSLAPFVRDPESSPGNALGVKLIKIYEQLLRYHDPELFNHLQELEIAPPIYGIRWLRLLFGREFSMQDLLVIWDAIFANSLSFDLVDYIFTAMLIFIRDLLLSSDYSSCISHLMRYPAVADVHYLVDLALHLKNPTQYKRPVGYSSQMLRHVPLVGGRKEIHRAPVSIASTSATTQQSTSVKSEGGRPTSLALPSGISDDPDMKAQQSQHFRAALNSEIEQPLSHAGATRQKQLVDQNNMAIPSQSECELQSDGILSHGMAKVLMGSDAGGVTGSTISHDTNYLETDKTKAARPMVKEMVPLVPQNIPSGSQPHGDHILKKKGKLYGSKHKEAHLKQLTAQLAEMKAMAEYCGQWMTVHIDKLQACMEEQELQHEDEMLISLAGLKRLRDILNGTVSFTREVMDNDEDAMFDPNAPSLVNNCSEKVLANVQDNQVDDFVVVQEDMCDGRNSLSPSKSLGSETSGSAKSNASEPQPEADSRGLGRSFASARRELCKLFLVSSPITEKQSEKHVNR